MDQHLPNLLAAYDVERLTPKEGSSVNLTLRPKNTFFDQPLKACQYDRRRQTMVCQDLHKKYQVEAKLQEVKEKEMPRIAAVLGLLCARKVCLHFPYCYGMTETFLIQESMSTTLAQILNTRPAPIKLNPYFLASVLFQIWWSLEVSARMFGFQHLDLNLQHIGFVHIVNNTNLLLTFQKGHSFFQVPTFGYLVKILPSRFSTLGTSNVNQDLQNLSSILFLRLQDTQGQSILDDKKVGVTQVIHNILKAWQSGSNNGKSFLEGFKSLFGSSQPTRKSFIFMMPRHSQGRNLVQDTM